MNTFRVARRLPSVRFTSTKAHQTSVLVAAPDFISNLRPAVYDGVWFKAVTSTPDPANPSSLPKTTLYQTDKDSEHPYELHEFPSTKGFESDKFFAEKESWNMEHRLLKQSLDAFNHAFWTDTNTRFNAYKHFVETATKASPEYVKAESDSQELQMEQATASFYQVWQSLEKKRQKAYTREMYRRTWFLIWYGLRLEVQKARWAIRSITTRDLV